MGIEIPEALQWAAKYVVGAGDWPEGDETAMRRMADAYNTAATTLDDLGDDAQRQVNQLLAALDGQSADAIEAFWKKLGNDDGALSALTGLLKDQADLVDDGANDIEHTKLMIIAQLVIFAVEMAAALAAMATGVGAPAGAAAGPRRGSPLRPRSGSPCGNCCSGSSRAWPKKPPSARWKRAASISGSG